MTVRAALLLVASRMVMVWLSPRTRAIELGYSVNSLKVKDWRSPLSHAEKCGSCPGSVRGILVNFDQSASPFSLNT